MKYGKLENDRITYAKFPLRIGNEDVFTNDSAIFLSQGFKEVINTPPEQKEGYYPVEHWEETETQIIRKWDYEPIPEEEATEADYINALDRMGVELND